MERKGPLSGPDSQSRKISSVFNTLERRIKEGNQDPWWIRHLDVMKKVSAQFVDGKLRVTPSIVNSKEVTRVYYRDVRDLFAGNMGGRFSYHEWSSRFFASTPVDKLPASVENAIPQLAIAVWWIGKRNGEQMGAGIDNPLAIIADAHIFDLPQQASQQSIPNPLRQLQPDPRIVEANIAQAIKLGEMYQHYDVASATVELQDVWWNKIALRPQFKPLLSIRTSLQVNTNSKVSMIGRDPIRPQDLRTFQISSESKRNPADEFITIILRAANAFSSSE